MEETWIVKIISHSATEPQRRRERERERERKSDAPSMRSLLLFHFLPLRLCDSVAVLTARPAIPPHKPESSSAESGRCRALRTPVRAVSPVCAFHRPSSLSRLRPSL